MALEILVNKLKKLLLFIFGLVKRSLCCFKRRRRSSCDSIPLTGVGVGTRYEGQNDDVENWTWEEPLKVVSEPNSVQHKIEMYRQQAFRQQPEKVEEHDPDFFEDMTPRITRQKKVHVRSNGCEQDVGLSSRLTFSPESLPSVGPELGSWEENEGQGNSWEEAESWDAAQLVREKRRAEREKMAAMKRDHGRSTLGSKVS
ncbi:receptor-binding cancer antigen expressed on SiSo cells [Macrosteles quadrilineatus]|uniref:receptor-binding cancer antigen expressed on SiSo cells n=1 Tax=Macrosteles quadrilineatus TaxID=74068 RepID=UPI0023E1F661|nr:receptor-binding cancer antigen expressed on SiSo cells [Macrosteles quadrilineatus]XP_054269799.1 receptor-binding cancer antigen expressed on SiSo cells [Macrosteles quadrilineatus]